MKCEPVQTCVQMKEEGRGGGDCVKGVPGVIFGPSCSNRVSLDNDVSNNNVHLSCAHQRPERSHDIY